MKKIYRNLLHLLIVFAVFISCSEEENGFSYDGEPLLSFTERGTNVTETVNGGQGTKEVKIIYGTANAVSGTHTVNLVFDAANSTAVENVDFEIVNSSDEIVAGESTGVFVIRLLESGISPNSALYDDFFALFTVSSTTLKNADFDQEYKMNLGMYCPPEFFLGVTSGAGDFMNTGWWMGSATVQIEEGTSSGTYVIKNYFEPGYDFVVSYDANNKVTFENQSTGYYHSTYSDYIWAYQSDVADSKYDPCSRTLTLYIDFYIPAAGGGWYDKTETFVGL